MKEQNYTWNSTENTTLLSTEWTAASNNSPVVTIAIAASLALISLIAVFGNALVLTAIYVNNNLRTTGNFFFANLALSDLLQGGIAIPFRLVELVYARPNHSAFCPISIALSILFGGSSNLNVVFISIERFIGVRWPFLYYTYMTTKGFFLAVIIFAWVSLAIFASLPLFGWGDVKSQGATFCRFPLFLTADYITALYALIHIIPICIIVPLYIFILRASLKSIRRIHSQEESVRTQKRRKRETATNDFEMEDTDANVPRIRKRQITEAARQRKSAKTVCLIVGMFILLIMPIVVIDIMEMAGGPTVPTLAIKIAVGMAYANHCVNVFIYAGCNGDYKKTFTKIFRKSHVS